MRIVMKIVMLGTFFKLIRNILRKMETHELWYGCIKEKYTDGVKLCYMYTDNFIILSKLMNFAEILKMMWKKRINMPTTFQIWLCLMISLQIWLVIKMIKPTVTGRAEVGNLIFILLSSPNHTLLFQ